MLYLDGNGEAGHYCWIKNMSRLVKSQITKHKESIHICDGCLIFFREKAGLDAHLNRGDCQKICTILPEPEKNFLEFKDFHLTFKTPFVIYSDFEAVLKPVQSCTPNPEEKYTMNTHIHEAHSFAYFIKCSYDDSLSILKSYRGKDCAVVYLKWLIADVRRIYKKCFGNPIPMKPLSPEESRRHDAATVCFICGERFQYIIKDGKPMISLMKVKDYDHFTGKQKKIH